MAKTRPLLDRLLQTPDLATIVPRLQPEILHRVIQSCGLEDCAEFVALATPDQLTRILDADLWRTRTPGGGEAFDVDRFGTWIAVLMESGAAIAAETLLGLDIDLAIAGFARHAAVFDGAAISPYTTLDGEFVPGRDLSGSYECEIGGYAIDARRTSAWDAIVGLLTFLSAAHPDYFHRLMRGCVRASNGPRERDGFHDLLADDDQDLFDLACGRDERRERLGFVESAEARAFLRDARDVCVDADGPPKSPIARAHFRDLAAATDPPQADGDAPPLSDSDPSARNEAAESEVAAVVEMLREAGVLAPPPRALLMAADRTASRLSYVEAHAASCPAQAEQLAFLANTIVAGCSIQGRPFTAREASDAAAAICNLGLENWPSPWSDPDLVIAFQVGWAILHRDVCMWTAERLIDVLAAIRCDDRDIQLRLDALRRELVRGVGGREPWRARDALEAIIMLDATAWAALLALIAECPVVHAAVGASRRRSLTIDPADFEFISETSQIADVRTFMATLPSLLI